MLFINIYKNVCRSRISQFSKAIRSKENRLEKYQQWNQEKRLLKTSIGISNIPKRFFFNKFNADDGNQDPLQIQLPPLTDDTQIILPSCFHMLINYYYHVRIKVYFDRTFDLKAFTEGSKKAVEVISSALAVEDYDSLEGLVTNDAINKLKERITRLSKVQKELIPVSEREIFIEFPYKIVVKNEYVEGQQKAFADISMVYYSLNGVQYNEESIFRSARIFSACPEKIFISNYTFRREYTNVNQPSSWIVTMCNEFMFTNPLPSQ